MVFVEMPIARQFGRGIIEAAIPRGRVVAIVPAGRCNIIAAVVVVASFNWGVVSAFARSGRHPRRIASPFRCAIAMAFFLLLVQCSHRPLQWKSVTTSIETNHGLVNERATSHKS